MKAKELHKAAEEFYVQNREEHLRKTIGTSDFCKSMMNAYHLHQTKKMLEGWTDERIEKNGKEGGLRDGELQLYWEGATWLRDELLKQLEQ